MIPFPLFSKTVSKKTSDRRPLHALRIACAVIAVAAGAVQGVTALDVGAKSSAEDNGISVDVWAVDPPTDAVLKNVANGMRAEVTFQIELYRKPHGFFSLFGDRLIEDLQITRSGMWDVYGKAYVIQHHDGSSYRTSDEDDFVRELFRLSEYLIPWRKFGDGASASGGTPSGNDERYLLVRVRVRPMKLVPALSMLSFLRMENEIVSDWRRLYIPAPR